MTGTNLTATATAFNEHLEAVTRRRESNLCVGLDPDCSRTRGLPGSPAEADVQLCMQAIHIAISAAAPYAAAFKPNAAFFEALETDRPLMAEMGRYLRDQYPSVIAMADAKRGDIGNTSAHYARAVFEVQQFDCITVNPLMGHDAVEPFTRNPQCGVFLLCLTSNPGADDFLNQNDLYLRIAEKAVEWNTRNNIGLVVGATRPEYLHRIREVAPDLPLLIPGIGAQGGQLKETLDAIGAKQNRRFLINASRSILYPAGATWESYAAQVARAASDLRDEIAAAMA